MVAQSCSVDFLMPYFLANGSQWPNQRTKPTSQLHGPPQPELRLSKPGLLGGALSLRITLKISSSHSHSPVKTLILSTLPSYLYLPENMKPLNLVSNQQYKLTTQKRHRAWLRKCYGYRWWERVVSFGGHIDFFSSLFSLLKTKE